MALSPMSEIDDIFAKAKPAPVDLPEASSSCPAPSREQKVKKRKRFTDLDMSHQEASSSKVKKHPIPKTTVDPSIPISKRRKSNPKSFVGSNPMTSKSRSQHDDENNFKDSRGLGPRRVTAEGWIVYKEDELQINNEGGDTPLCPFDCDCCF